MAKQKRLSWTKLLFYLAIPLAVGTVSGLLVREGFSHFEARPQPALTPPPWGFPVVWTLLYSLMGVASYLIAVNSPLKRDSALSIYFLQLLFNFFWPLLFFGFEAYLGALLWLAALFLLVLYTTVCFWRINTAAGWLMLPYLIWLIFAAYLNFGVYLLNR